MKRFAGKTALVTGGTSGIGLATARRLQDEGARVIVTGTRDKTLEEARKVLGSGVVVFRNDAGHPKSIEPVSRDAVHGQLLLLHEHARLVFELGAWVDDEF